VLGPHDVVTPQPVQDGDELRCVAQFSAQLPGSAVTGLDLRRRVAVEGDACRAERQAELQLLRRSLGTLRQICEQAEARGEVRDRLGVGRGP
jgi:hypothetical protein